MDFGLPESGTHYNRIAFPYRKEAYGEPNNALKAYINRLDRIRSVLEYYLREKLPEDPEDRGCQEISGFMTVRNLKGKLTFRERDYLGETCAWGFRLGLENQETINLTYPRRLMELDCITYGKNIEKTGKK